MLPARMSRCKAFCAILLWPINDDEADDDIKMFAEGFRDHAFTVV